MLRARGEYVCVCVCFVYRIRWLRLVHTIDLMKYMCDGVPFFAFVSGKVETDKQSHSSIVYRMIENLFYKLNFNSIQI